jgi:hypothetical protein
VLRVDQKHLQEHNVMNVTGVIITTNHKSDGIYLPPTTADTTSPGRTLRRRNSPKAPPPKTQAFFEIVNANHAPENTPLADALDLLHNPSAVTLDAVLDQADSELAIWARDRRNRRVLPHRFEECGYAPVRNEGAKSACLNGASCF